MEEKKDDNISAMCTVAVGEAGKTGDWRSVRPVIDRKKCIPSLKKQVGLFSLLALLSEGWSNRHPRGN